jgi:membrane fusion protein, adhesin transport system
MMKREKPHADLYYSSEITRALLSERQVAAGLTVALLATVLVSAIWWASTQKVEEITKGNAHVIASSREQLVQSLEGGIVSALLVKEGQVVNKGEPLVRIDPTKAQASFAEGQSKSVALKVAAARLRAEAQGTSLKFPSDVASFSTIVRDETNMFNTRKRALDEGVTTLSKGKQFLVNELAITEPMAIKGLVAETEVLRMRRQLNEIDMQIQERVNKYRTDAASELARIESEVAQTREVVTARKDQVLRTVIGAPVRGTVKNIKVNTIGGVVQPGQEIMEIVPLEDKLLIEAKIRPHDVAFLRPGLGAMVKVSAYDFSIYGGLPGKIELISPDTLREERKSEEDTYYRVLIRTDKSTLTSEGRELPIFPGMTATVEIRTGEKTVIDYLLKPVFKVREALRER